MARLLLLMICVFGVYLESTASTTIECDYGTARWRYIENAYYCYVDNILEITTKDAATITSISGDHQSGKTNSDVEVLYLEFRTTYYFPRGLETFFENLKMIRVQINKLKEIHQADLKPFPKLVELDLYFNSLEVLEEGLFDYNPDLQWIDLYSNKIIHIEPKIFDHLNKLKLLKILANTCVKNYDSNAIPEVRKVIRLAESQCKNSEFSSLKDKLENLGKDSKSLNSEEFSKKFVTFEETFDASKFSKFRPLNYKFGALKNLTIRN